MPRVRLGLLEPIGTADAIAQVIGDLCVEMARKLMQAGTGARRLDLHFERVDGHRQAVRVGTATPSRDASHLSKLLRQKIEADPAAPSLILTEPGVGYRWMGE